MQVFGLAVMIDATSLMNSDKKECLCLWKVEYVLVS